MLPRLFVTGIAVAVVLALAAFGGAGSTAQASDVLLIDASPDSATNVVDTIHTVTAVVTDNGQPAPDLSVSIDILSGPNTGFSDSGTTDSNGEVVFQYIGNGGAGTDQIEVCLIGFGGFGCEIVEKTWVEPPPTPTPAPEPTATPTPDTAGDIAADTDEPAALPDTGSRPPSAGGIPWLGAIMLTLAGAALAAGGWAISTRTR